ncbi:hypothetical protein MASR2M78_13780 [Treponema sp.]
MNEIGRILQIQGKTVTIKGGELGGCFGCVDESCRVNGNRFEAKNRRGFELEVGQFVEIDSPAGATALQALFVFGPPVLFFIFGYLLSGRILPASTDALRAAAGFLGMVLGFFGVYGYSRMFPSKTAPEVIRVLNEQEAAQAAPVQP